MELGGNAPAIVFEDADVRSVAESCAGGALKYAGQRCSAVSRILVDDAVHDELVARLDREMGRGPAVRRRNCNRPADQRGSRRSSRNARRRRRLEGASLVRGSRDPPIHAPAELEPLYFQPTLLADVPPDARILSEEQFGPIAAVTRFDDRSEAVDRANDSELALDAAVFTQAYERALEVADRLDAGASESMERQVTASVTSRSGQRRLRDRPRGYRHLDPRPDANQEYRSVTARVWVSFDSSCRELFRGQLPPFQLHRLV
ncbi:aldehyde dehydrogenase family protein [Natrialba swarupiae]|nr:aldehyde dehydrogenase family protein [Natrialba swarupiae]